MMRVQAPQIFFLEPPLGGRGKGEEGKGKNPYRIEFVFMMIMM